MGRDSWIPVEELFVVAPTNAEDILALRNDITQLIQQFDRWDEDFIDWLLEHPTVVTIIYHHDTPIAYIRIDDNENNPDEIGRKSLEFSGCVMPEYRDRGITQLVAPRVIRKAFMKTGKKKMLAKIHQANKEAIAAIVALGFTHVGHETDDPSIKIYRLTREEMMNGNTP